MESILKQQPFSSSSSLAAGNGKQMDEKDKCFFTDPLFELASGDKLKPLPFITDPLLLDETSGMSSLTFPFCKTSEKFQTRQSMMLSSSSSSSQGTKIFISGRSIPIHMLSSIERVGVIPYMKLLATSSLQAKKVFSAEEEKIGSLSKYWFALGIDAIHGELTDCGGKRTSALEPIERTAVRELYEESMTLFDYRKRECDILNSPVVTNGKICIFFLRIHPPFSKSGFPFDLPKLFVNKRRQFLSGKSEDERTNEKNQQHQHHYQHDRQKGFLSLYQHSSPSSFSSTTPMLHPRRHHQAAISSSSLNRSKFGIVLKTPRGGEHLKNYSDYLNGKTKSSLEENIEDAFGIQKPEDSIEEVDSNEYDETNTSLYSISIEDTIESKSVPKIIVSKEFDENFSSLHKKQRQQRRKPVFFENSLMYWIPFDDVKNLTHYKASSKGGVFTKGYHMSPVPMTSVSLSVSLRKEDSTINEISKLISTARDNFEAIKDATSSSPYTISFGTSATFSSKKKMSLSMSQNIIASSKDESEIPFNHPYLYENIRKILFEQIENIKEYL